MPGRGGGHGQQEASGGWWPGRRAAAGRRQRRGSSCGREEAEVQHVTRTGEADAHECGWEERGVGRRA